MMVATPQGQPSSGPAAGLLSPLLGHWPPGAARLNRLSDLETDKDVTVTLKFALLVLCSVCSYKGRTEGRLNIRGVHLSLSHKGRIFSGPFSGSRVVYHNDVQCSVEERGWEGIIMKKKLCVLLSDGNWYCSCILLFIYGINSGIVTNAVCLAGSRFRCKGKLVCSSVASSNFTDSF